jgi:hypothetical protein
MRLNFWQRMWKGLESRSPEGQRSSNKNRRRLTRPVARLQLEELEKRELLSGFWTQLTNNAPGGLGTMMLLSDGTVMAQNGGSTAWYQLTPAAFSGSYTAGTWSTRASMSATRLYYASNVLSNNKVFVMGGEYSSAGGDTNRGEMYDTVANTWSSVTNFPQSNFGDDPSAMLPDGRILTGYISGPATYIYNPATNAWSFAANKLRGDGSDEEGWVKLPDSSILSYDVFSSASTGTFHAQRYIPATNTWVDASTVDATNPPTILSSGSQGSELGPGFLLPNGKVIYFGANGNTAIYNPTTDKWSAGFHEPQKNLTITRTVDAMGNVHYVVTSGSPTDVPTYLVATDDPGAMLPNGHILIALSPLGPLEGGGYSFPEATYIYEYDPTAATPAAAWTDVTPGGFPLSNINAYNTRMVMLPSGQALLASTTTTQVDAFTANEAPSPAWRPTINEIHRSGGTVTLTGTQINGISEGATYGDDVEMASNYPLVEALAPFLGNVYLRTSNWSSTGVAEGSTPESVQFSLGTGLDTLLHVSGAGISSPTALAIEMSPSVNNITLRVDPGNPANLQILNNGSFFDSQPFNAFSNIMVTCDSSTDTLTVDYSFGNPIPGGGLNYSFGPGVDTLNVNDPSSSNQTWTLGTSSVQRSGSGPITFNGGINFVNVNGGSGNNTYNIFGTEPGWATHVNTGGGVDTVNIFGTSGSLAIDAAGSGGSGGDVVNIGSGGSLAGIQGSVSIENEPSRDTVNIFGQNDGAAHTATIDTVTRSGDTSLGRLQGVSAPITWDYFDTSVVNINLGSGTTVVNILGTGVTTNVFNNGLATINVGSGNSMSGIVGTLNLENEPSEDLVNIFDQSDTTAHTATIDTVTRAGDTSLGRLSGIGAAPITWDYFDSASGVNINFGAGTSLVNVLGTGVTTNLFNSAAATINIGNSNSVAGIQGTLNLENEPSFDTVNINDQSDSTAHTATIDTVTRSGETSLGRLQGIGAAPITWDYNDTTAVNINFGGGTNIVNVLGTGVTTNLFSTVFSTVNIGSSNTIAGIQGTLNLENEPSADVVIINDQNDTTFRSATIETVPRSGDTSLGRLQGMAAAITWDYFDTSSVTINTGSGGAAVSVLGTGVTTTLNGNAAGVNTLVGGNVNTTWNITGANAGNLSNANAFASFTNFQNLTGGTATDTFNFSNGASLSGTVNGGGGTNTLNESAYTTPVTVNLAANTATGTGGIANLQNFIGGSGNNTLVGPNAPTTWNITVQNAGNLNGSTTFSAFQNLTGGSAADAFVFANGVGVNGNIDGGGGINMLDYAAYSTGVTVDLTSGTATGVGGTVANIQQLRGGAGNDSLTGNLAGTTTFFASPGNDTVTGQGSGNSLVGPNAASTWSITAQNAGTLTWAANTTTFTGIQSLTGGSAADAFVLSDGVGVDGAVDGGGGSNTLDESAYTTAVTVNLAAHTATGLGGTFASLQSFLGGSGSNTLVGPNAATTWNVTAQNTGTLTGGFSFSGFGNLTGGSAADTFAFADGTGVTGNIDGGGGSNTLNESAYTTAVTVDLTANTVTGVGGTIANLQSFVGAGAGGSNLKGPAATTTWNIIGGNTGTLSGGFSFSAFPNLTGGAGNNAFVIGSGASVDGTITGGGGTNTLDYSAYTGNVIVDLQTGFATASGGVSGTFVNVHGANSAGPGLYNLLIGNGGNVLTGGSGRRNILVAGLTASTLGAGTQEDLLIGGFTGYDNDPTDPALLHWQQIAAYWAGSDPYNTRVNNLENGIGVPILDSTTVTGNGGSNTINGAGALALIYTDGADAIAGFDPGSQQYTITP